MPHARTPAARKRRHIAAEPAPEPENEHVRDKRLIANLFGTFDISRCGRQMCARAGRCVGPGAFCFDENRQHILDAIQELVDSDLFADEAEG